MHLWICLASATEIAVMGDLPYAANEWAVLADHVKTTNENKDLDLLIHVGDIKKGKWACEEKIYTGVRQALDASTHPVMILVGDNEWNDCGKGEGPGPEVGWALWQEHLAPLNAAHAHQDKRPENMAWTDGEVLVLGLLLPGGRIHDEAVWDAFLDDTAEWVREQFAAHPDAHAVVVAGHANPDAEHAKVVTAIQESAAAYGGPVLYVHGDKHTWEDEAAWGAPNLRRVQVVQGGYEGPLTITATAEGITLERAAKVAKKPEGIF